MMLRCSASRAEQIIAFKAEGDRTMLRFISDTLTFDVADFTEHANCLMDVPDQAKRLMNDRFPLREFKDARASVRANCLVVGAYRDMLQILRGPYKTLSPEDIIHLTTDNKTIATIALMAQRKTFEFAKLIKDINTQGAYVSMQDATLVIDSALPVTRGGEKAGCPHRESPLFGKFIAHVGQIAAVAAQREMPYDRQDAWIRRLKHKL